MMITVGEELLLCISRVRIKDKIGDCDKPPAADCCCLHMSWCLDVSGAEAEAVGSGHVNR